jgi:hypothetical protein
MTGFARIQRSAGIPRRAAGRARRTAIEEIAGRLSRGNNYEKPRKQREASKKMNT